MSEAKSSIRKWAWKLAGALIMRDKGPPGKEVQAVSAHKLLGLVLFVICAEMWASGFDPPDMLVYSWWALLGLVDVAKSALGMLKR